MAIIGATIPVDVNTFAWPDCYEPDGDDADVYATIMRLLDEAERTGEVAWNSVAPVYAGAQPPPYLGGQEQW